MKQQSMHQSGIGMIGAIVWCFVIASILLVAFKVGPLYMDHWTRVNAISSLSDQEDLSAKRRLDIMKMIHKRFVINSLEPLAANEIKLDVQGNRLFVHMDYEKRVNLVANLDVVVSFNESVEVSEP